MSYNPAAGGGPPADGSVSSAKLGGDVTAAGKSILTAATKADQRAWLEMAVADVSGLQTALDAKAGSTHTHAINDTTGLQTALDGKAASSHTHAAADIASGTIATARLGSGTANNTTFLRGDQTWATPAGGSGHFTYVYGASDLNRTASTTVTADDTLTIALSAATRYWIEAVILMEVNASADYEFQWTYSGTFTHVTYIDERNVAGAAAGTGTRTARYNTTVPATALPATAAIVGTTGGAALITLTMACLTNASGTFAFSWAPDATGFTCTRRAGSYLRYKAL